MDFAIAEFFNHLGRGTVADQLSVIVSYNGLFIALFLAAGSFSLSGDRINFRKFILALLVSVALHYSVSEGFLKVVVPEYLGVRERPYIAYPQEISPLGTRSVSTSFPSNHMSSVVSTLGVLAYFCRRYWKAVAVFAVLTGLSRMHNGMHYPSDVLGGALLGLIYVQVAVYLVRRYIKDRESE
ncbi:MAG: phosphatase PAP2 family protein [Parcubacteria group bacterium]